MARLIYRSKSPMKLALHIAIRKNDADKRTCLDEAMFPSQSSL